MALHGLQQAEVAVSHRRGRKLFKPDQEVGVAPVRPVLISGSRSKEPRLTNMEAAAEPFDFGAVLFNQRVHRSASLW